MKVLVTGGCGFIGSHVAEAYAEEGHDVIVVDNLSTGKRENLDRRARFYLADICGPSLEEVVKKERPDLINHLAAQISVPLSVKDPMTDADINIKGTMRLLDLSRQYGVKKFIFSSTGGAIYGDAREVPTRESYFPEPESPYAIAKFSAENYIRFYAHTYGFGHVILRYSNVFGPRQIPHGEAGVVAIFTESLLAGRGVTVNHFPDEPEGMTRDYCYVKDISAANLLATKTRETGIFNIGTGRGTRTMELYRAILETLRRKGVDLPSSFDNPARAPAREGDIHVSTLDASKARERLGFDLGFDLGQGIEATIDWYLAAR